MNIFIKKERKKDYKIIKRINDEAFGQENEGIMVDVLRQNPGYNSLDNKKREKFLIEF